MCEKCSYKEVSYIEVLLYIQIIDLFTHLFKCQYYLLIIILFI